MKSCSYHDPAKYYIYSLPLEYLFDDSQLRPAVLSVREGTLLTSEIGSIFSVERSLLKLRLVLAGPSYKFHTPDPNFEVDDPSTGSWRKLASLPLLEESSNYFVGRTTLRLSMWLLTISYVFHQTVPHLPITWWRTNGRLVTELFLFDGFNGEQWKNYITNPSDTVCGPPFDFYGNVIHYEEDILLCSGRSPFLAVAYQMDRRRVVRKQKLLSCWAHNIASLVDLGGGYFCCLRDTHPRDYNDPDFAYFTFKVSKMGGVVKHDPRCEFLECEILKEWVGRMNLEQSCELVSPFIDNAVLGSMR